MKKRIVICLDGTWNQVMDPATVTNVVKIAQAVRPIANDQTPQIVYYNSGVGTGDLVDKVLGGIFGRGLRNNVKRAYAFLSLNYNPGDEIYIFGFSRGAYTARALAGVIGASGILEKHQFQNFEVAWNYYRLPKSVRKVLELPTVDVLASRIGFSLSDDVKATVAKLKERCDARMPSKLAAYLHFKMKGSFIQDVRIRCVGVWDTVGSYGIPAGVGLGALMRIVTAWLLRGFHDTEIGDKVDIGLHAVALDERRRPFAPTFWTIDASKQPVAHVEQVWFAGSHANVGGSYKDTGLSSLSLIWMCARVAELGQQTFGSALDFDEDFLKACSDPSPFGTLYRSEAGWPVSTVFPYRRPVLAPRAVKVNVFWNGEDPKQVHVAEQIHWSVFKRLGNLAAIRFFGNSLLSFGLKSVYDPKNLTGVTIPPDRITQPTPMEQRINPQ